MLAQTLSLTAVIIVGVVGQQFQDPNQQQFNQQPPQQVRHDLILLSFLKKHYRQTDQNHTKFACAFIYYNIFLLPRLSHDIFKNFMTTINLNAYQN